MKKVLLSVFMTQCVLADLYFHATLLRGGHMYTNKDLNNIIDGLPYKKSDNLDERSQRLQAALRDTGLFKSVKVQSAQSFYSLSSRCYVDTVTIEEYPAAPFELNGERCDSRFTQYLCNDVLKIYHLDEYTATKLKDKYFFSSMVWSDGSKMSDADEMSYIGCIVCMFFTTLVICGNILVGSVKHNPSRHRYSLSSKCMYSCAFLIGHGLLYWITLRWRLNTLTLQKLKDKGGKVYIKGKVTFHHTRNTIINIICIMIDCGVFMWIRHMWTE